MRKIGRDVGNAQRAAFESLARKSFGEPALEDESNVRIFMRVLRNEDTRRVPDFFQREPIGDTIRQGGAVKFHCHDQKESNTKPGALSHPETCAERLL